MTQFAGKAALVTGASSGIGRATARLLLERGATVLITARREASLTQLGDELGAGDRSIPVTGDLTNHQFRASLIASAHKEMGGLDILVNAAGILVAGTWDGTDLEDWDRTMDINLRTVYDLSRLAIPLLKERHGTIVNVSSVAGPRAFPGVLAYCVSKAGVDQLTRCLALELAAHGVRVNAVNPGVVQTELHRAGGMDEESYAAFLEHSRTTHPLGRVGQPNEVAELVTFLASSEAGWITGETVAIDGGRAQTCAR